MWCFCFVGCFLVWDVGCWLVFFAFFIFFVVLFGCCLLFGGGWFVFFVDRFLVLFCVFVGLFVRVYGVWFCLGLVFFRFGLFCVFVEECVLFGCWFVCVVLFLVGVGVVFVGLFWGMYCIGWLGFFGVIFLIVFFFFVGVVLFWVLGFLCYCVCGIF